jgi:hypothetical protein
MIGIFGLDQFYAIDLVVKAVRSWETLYDSMNESYKIL